MAHVTMGRKVMVSAQVSATLVSARRQQLPNQATAISA
jgi:hypothetical protein